MSDNRSDATPMMQQYLRIKEKHRDSVLFFRLGDFYEMFQNDAREVSQLLNLTLTQRNGVPMCGIPYHAAQNYIGRLLRAGRKIAICEQTALPEKGQKLAVREVTEIITPGTVIDDNFLQGKDNNYLAAVCESGSSLSFSCADLSTGDFYVTAFPSSDKEKLKRELYRMSPKEILLPESMAENQDYRFLLDSGSFINRFPDWYFDTGTAFIRLTQQFGTVNLKSFGLSEKGPEIPTAGALLDYIGDNSKTLVPHIKDIKKISDDDYVSMDEATQRNLEIVRNLQDGTIKNSLLEVLDETRTASGGRKLRFWLLHPLVRIEDIEARLDRVEYFYRNQKTLSETRRILGQLLDLERLCSRIAMNRASPKDLVSLGRTLVFAEDLDILLHKSRAALDKIPDQFSSLYALGKTLLNTLSDEPPLNLSDGQIIRTGYDPVVDHYRELQTRTTDILDHYLNEVKTETGLTTLRIKYNKIIGYYFEISKGQADNLPPLFIRRQSLVNGERFTTEKLSALETEILEAADKLIDREKQIFLQIRDELKPHIDLIMKLGASLSETDCYQAFSYAATRNGYVRPVLGENRDFRLIESRHPVVERNLPPGAFIPNTIDIDTEKQPVLLVTGPNMAGKSTLLRQTALCVLMAQTGSFVAAAEARIGLVDKIFCRVGASDNLARGESTFLVEMNETAYILRNATPGSLLILDEVGRGTGTDDGLALAWSILEYLVHQISGRTFFATHYHELTRMPEIRLRNISMAVSEEGRHISFVRKLKEGPASSSYGIHVAAMAGLPRNVIIRAEEVLNTLRTLHGDGGSTPRLNPPNFGQQELFNPWEPVLEEIRNLAIGDTTPLQALEMIDKWKKNLLKGNQS